MSVGCEFAFRSHNLKVRGSNPLPATSDSTGPASQETGPLLFASPVSLKAMICARSPNMILDVDGDKIADPHRHHEQELNREGGLDLKSLTVR